MNYEQRYRFEYWVDGEKKVCYPKSEAKKNENAQYCKEHRMKYKATKLYPFSTNKNQHNFELVKNRCYNLMHDMVSGDSEYNEEEFDRLEELASKAMQYFTLPLPVAWLDWETLKDAKEVASLAVEFRVNTCIENGRLDLIQYC